MQGPLIPVGRLDLLWGKVFAARLRGAQRIDSEDRQACRVVCGTFTSEGEGTGVAFINQKESIVTEF